ncbi:MAG TPA: hypothetical protein VFO85_20030, partial [Vicinamibacteria bacterium]|nr:hypothetical protein [Vicinamibacteria bacterium]
MSDRSGRYLRVALGLALVVLAIVQVQQFAQSLRAQQRQAEQLARAVEAPLRALRPQIAAALAYAGPEAWERAATVASAAHPEAEVELFDSAGRRLLARPRPAPVQHLLDEQQARALAAGGVLTVGPVAGEGARLLTYAAFRSGDAELVMRVAVEPPGLAEDVRDRRRALASHVMVVLSLILAAVLVLSPLRPAS